MSHRLYPEERQEQIIGLLKESGRVPVADLSARFHLSPATIRADLDTLAQESPIVARTVVRSWPMTPRSTFRSNCDGASARRKNIASALRQ